METTVGSGCVVIAVNLCLFPAQLSLNSAQFPVVCFLSESEIAKNLLVYSYEGVSMCMHMCVNDRLIYSAHDHKMMSCKTL